MSENKLNSCKNLTAKNLMKITPNSLRQRLLKCFTPAGGNTDKTQKYFDELLLLLKKEKLSHKRSSLNAHFKGSLPVQWPHPQLGVGYAHSHCHTFTPL